MDINEWYSALTQLFNENLRQVPTLAEVTVFFEQGYSPEDTYEAKVAQTPVTIDQPGTKVAPEMKPSDYLKQVLDSPEYPHLNEQDILARIVDKQYQLTPSGTMVLCEVTMENRWRFIGQWAPISSETFDVEKGKARALTDAIKQAWNFEAYLLKERMYQQYLAMKKEGQ